MVLAVAAIASLLMMAMNVNTWNANAIELSKFKDFQGIDDIGQSAECVIVVVGCDGQGSVGSSGDVNIGVGDNDTTTNGGDTPLPPIDPTIGEGCIGTLDIAVVSAIAVALGLAADVSLAEICEALDAVPTVGALVVILAEAGLTALEIVDLLGCLGIDITLAEVIAILGL